MQKILFVVENYYPKTSGVPVVVQYLAEGLAKYENYEIHVATRIDEGLQQIEEKNRVVIHRFSLWYNILKRPTGNINEYKEFVQNNNFDCIILECTQCVTTDALIRKMDYMDSILILHSHGFSGMELKPFQIMSSVKHTFGNTVNYFIWKHYYESVIPNCLKLFKTIICLSKVDKDYFYLTARHKHVVVLPNAAENSFFQSSHNNISKYLQEFPESYFITVAYYSDVKNQLGVLKQYYKSKSSKKSCMLFIGTEKNSYYDKLVKMKSLLDKKAGTRKVYFLTGVERNDIPGIIGGATLYLSGSRREAFSISLIEAMALGIPFIGTNVGNTSELPGGITLNNIDEMHEQIDFLMADIEMRKKLGKIGKQYTKKYCQVQIAVDTLKEIMNLDGKRDYS